MRVGGKNDYEVQPNEITDEGVLAPEIRAAIMADLGGVVALAARGPQGQLRKTIFTIAIEAEPK